MTGDGGDMTRCFGLRLASLLLLVCVVGCQRNEGAPTTQTRGVDAFHSIELRGAATLDVLVGTQQSVVVEGGSELLSHLQTEVRNERLVIESRGGSWFWQRGENRLKVRITVPVLRALELNGAGRISINGVSGGALALILSGAGDLTASGQVDALTARINGAGDIDLSRLQATDAEVAVNGAGSLQAAVTHQLDATLNGVGSITYAGTPAVLNTAIHGVGSIRQR
jgi:putative autotransporter adhesin-like protein